VVMGRSNKDIIRLTFKLIGVLSLLNATHYI